MLRKLFSVRLRRHVNLSLCHSFCKPFVDSAFGLALKTKKAVVAPTAINADAAYSNMAKKRKPKYLSKINTK